MFISFLWGVFVRGFLARGGFVQGVFVRGFFVRGGFVLIPFQNSLSHIPSLMTASVANEKNSTSNIFLHLGLINKFDHPQNENGNQA